MREGLLQSSELAPQKPVSRAQQDVVLRMGELGGVNWNWRLAGRPLAGDAERMLEMEGA